MIRLLHKNQQQQQVNSIAGIKKIKEKHENEKLCDAKEKKKKERKNGTKKS